VSQPDEITRCSSCPLCGAADLVNRPVPRSWAGGERFRHLRGRLGLAECRGCDLVFANPRLSGAQLASFYASDGYDCHHEATPAASASRDHEALARLEARTAGRRLLDYGCGAGGLLHLAARSGWQAQGYDASPVAVETCRRQGLRAAADLMELADGTFDAVVLQHVLEHLPEPGAALLRVRGLLDPGGWLLVEVPNVRSLRARLSHPLLVRWARFDERHRAFPLHLWYFGPRSLRTMLARAGFGVVDLWTRGVGLPLRVPPPEARGPQQAGVASSTGRKRPLGVLRRLARALSRGLVLERGLGENLVVLARPVPEVGQRST
jgi:SAM-dependent methyltransferase